MFQQGFCSSFDSENSECLQQHNDCPPIYQQCPIDYPSPRSCLMSNYSKPMLSKEKHGSFGIPPTSPKQKHDPFEVPPLAKKLKKRIRRKPSPSKDSPLGSNKPSNCTDHKDDGYEPVEKTCTQFMEIIQNAVQETTKEYAKSAMQDIYGEICSKIDEMSSRTAEMSCNAEDVHKKISSKMNEISSQMKDIKEIVNMVATQNDLRFKCLCDFIFTLLKTDVKPNEEDDNDGEDNEDEEFENIFKTVKKVKTRSECGCQNCIEKREREKRLMPSKKSADSQKSNIGQNREGRVENSIPTKMSSGISQVENRYTPSIDCCCSKESICMEGPKVKEVDCSNDLFKPIPNIDLIKPTSNDKEVKLPQCYCEICNCNHNLRDAQKPSPSPCYCNERKTWASATPPVPPRRKSRGYEAGPESIQNSIYRFPNQNEVDKSKLQGSSANDALTLCAEKSTEKSQD